MKIYSEVQIRYFDFWSGAKETANIIEEYNLWDVTETIVDELFPDGCSETELNDFFWFEDTYLFELLGIDPYNEKEEE